ncbi:MULTISPECIES: hypothetical protein [Methylotenera]|uniref:hypothetical protein n=1 Tax=Methylotenera TaxID=359407 RepID=UPI0003720A07|nr:MULTISPECIES: hypothetical protein [Methylotenera]
MMLTKTPQNIWFKLTFIAFSGFLALVFGLISVTNNPIFIGLAVGMVLGIFLLAMPKKIIWLVIFMGLATPALLDMAGHGFSRMLWAISMLALLLWVPGIFCLIRLNPIKEKHVPFFIWMAGAFVIYALISSVLNLHSLSELSGGFKRYFQAFGLMLVLATMMLTRKDMDGWLKLLLGIALLQLPFALFERFVLVALRGGMAAGGEATDVVAGTMGANLQGGSPNAIMVTFVLIAFAFVFARWKEKLIDTSRLFLLSVLLLTPLILGETKVVVVMLPIMALVLLRKDIKKEPLKYLPIFLALLLLTLALAYIYVYYMLDSNFVEAFNGIISYNVGTVGYGKLLLNRTTAMTFWWGLHGWADPMTFMLGHGLGSSYGSGQAAGHMAQIYPGYGINLTTISSILWDLGLAGLVLYTSVFFTAWVQVGNIWKRTQSKKIKADCMAIQAGIALTFLFIIYSDSQVNLLVHEIIIAVMLGYAAFLYQEQYQETLAEKLEEQRQEDFQEAPFKVEQVVS